MTGYKNGKSDDFQPSTGQRKAALVLQILSGKITISWSSMSGVSVMVRRLRSF